MTLSFFFPSSKKHRLLQIQYIKFRSEHWKIKGGEKNVFDFPFEDSRVPKICFLQFCPLTRSLSDKEASNNTARFPEMEAHFRSTTRSLSIYVYNNERGTVSTVFDSSPENTGEQKNPENSVNSLRFENRGEKLKFISVRTIGIRAISFRKRTSFFQYFR